MSSLQDHTGKENDHDRAADKDHLEPPLAFAEHVGERGFYLKWGILFGGGIKPQNFLWSGTKLTKITMLTSDKVKIPDSMLTKISKKLDFSDYHNLLEFLFRNLHRKQRKLLLFRRRR